MEIVKSFKNLTIQEERDEEANSSIALVMVIFSCLQVILILLFYYAPDEFSYFFTNGYALFGISILLLIPSMIQLIMPVHIKIMKYILLPVFVVSLCALDYTFSFFSFVTFVLPAILVSRYNSTKYSFVNWGISLLGLTIVTFIIYFNVNQGNYVGVFDYYFDLTNPFQLFVVNYGLKVVFYFIVAACSMLIMMYNKSMTKKETEASNKITYMKSELETASKIQSSILPVDFSLATGNGFHLNALMEPAKEVAGDFYDFFYIKDKLIVLVGDVSDKGLSAAMFMMNVKNTIKALSTKNSNISSIITDANKIISSNNKEMMFVTLWVACIDVLTGKGEYINAGHCPAFIKDANNGLIKLESEPQIFLGVDSSVTFESVKFEIPKGSCLFIYTDGVTDAIDKDGNHYGEENLELSLKRTSSEPKQMLDDINNDLYNFSSETTQFDDITMLALYNKGYSVEKEYPWNIDSVEDIISDINNIITEHTTNVDLLNLIDTAIDDAVSNIVDYAKSSDSDKIIAKYDYFDNKIAITFVDSGKYFDPLKIEAPDFSENRKIGGLGIYLFRNIMDEVKYKRIDDKNYLTLIKKIV